MNIFIYGSADGETWESKPLFSFPKKSYCGSYPAYLDLSAKPGVRYLRAAWQMCRWDRNEPVPLFDFYIKAELARVAAAVA
ncbi:MAG: hypothetical protein ABI823_00115 [Bryobacteraceae bacterium]